LGIETNCDMETELENIENKEFNKEKKGFNKAEVKEYLKILSEELNSASNKIQELQYDLDYSNAKLEDYQRIDSEIRKTLIFLQENEKDGLTKTQDEVSSMIKEAEIKSEKIIIEAETEAKSTRDTLLFLKEQHEIMLARLKIIVDSQEGMLNDFKMGNNSLELQKSMTEAAISSIQPELNIDKILEKLL